MGTGGLKAIRAVLPPATLVYAVGGVGPDDFAAWRAAGAARLRPRRLAVPAGLDGGARRRGRPRQRRGLRRRLRRAGPMIRRALGVCYYPEHWPEDRWAEDAAPHGRGRPHLGAHRRVRLVADRADARRPRLGLARPGDRDARRGRAQGRARHARPPRRRAGWSTSIPTCWPWTSTGARAGFGSRRHYDFSHRRLPRGVRAHRPPARRPLRQQPARRRLADRQRIRLPRHRLFLFAGGRGGLPRLARGEIRRRRRAERRLGQRVLVDGVRPPSSRSTCRT